MTSSQEKRTYSDIALDVYYSRRNGVRVDFLNLLS